jgi:hypothetical protein
MQIQIYAVMDKEKPHRKIKRLKLKLSEYIFALFSDLTSVGNKVNDILSDLRKKNTF